MHELFINAEKNRHTVKKTINEIYSAISDFREEHGREPTKIQVPPEAQHIIKDHYMSIKTNHPKTILGYKLVTAIDNNITVS